MSLKYRLVLLTLSVFAVTFGAGMLLGLHGARRLAEGQLRSLLRRSAEALARSSAPLNDAVLGRLPTLPDAHTLVLDADGRIIAHGAAGLPWSELARALGRRGDPGAPPAWLNTSRGRFLVGLARRREPASGETLTVALVADETAVHRPTRAILHGYLIILLVTAALLAAGMYLVGFATVRRIGRLQRRIDSTLSQAPARRSAGGDEVARLSAAFDDLLERWHRSREKLLDQQRLATTGKLASSVAHEVRNPLQAIRLTVQMLREKAPPADRQGYDLILSEMDRLSLLTDELLVLAGKGSLRIESVDIRRELEETLRLLHMQLRQRGVRTETHLSDLPAVRMDRNRCRQLLLNLLLNAVEASPRGSTVRVEGAVAAEGLVLRIADAGEGFPQAVLDGQAEEFFSTKTSGSGLGLSICRRILSEAGGGLRLYNTAAGAVAEVVLPVQVGASGGDAGP